MLARVPLLCGCRAVVARLLAAHMQRAVYGQGEKLFEQVGRQAAPAVGAGALACQFQCRWAAVQGELLNMQGETGATMLKPTNGW